MNKRYYLLASAAACLALATACGKKEETAQADPARPDTGKAAPVALDAGSRLFNCRGFIYPNSGPRKDDVAKVHADSPDEAKQKATAYFEQKNWTLSECAEDTLYTGTTRAQTVPRDQYRELASNSDVMYLYHANSKMPVPYEEIATSEFSAFASEADVFKRKAALEQLRKTIDDNIAGKANQKFVSFKMDASLNHFDMQSNTFTISNVQLGDGAYFRFFDGNQTYKVLMNGDPQLLAFKTKTMEDAQAIESTIKGQARPVSLKFYGQVMKAAEMSREKYVVVEVTATEVYDGNGAGRDAKKLLLTTFN